MDKVGIAVGYKRKTWQEKLEDKEGYPKILKLERKFPCYNAAHKMGAEVGDEIVLVNPSEVVEIMKKVPEGKLMTIIEICERVAKNHGAKACCSLTAGIFTMVAANAVEEASQQKRKINIPYWRVLKADGSLNEKYPGGGEAQKEKLEKEGFVVVKKGKKYAVKGYRNFLQTESGC